MLTQTYTHSSTHHPITKGIVHRRCSVFTHPTSTPGRNGTSVRFLYFQIKEAVFCIPLQRRGEGLGACIVDYIHRKHGGGPCYSRNVSGVQYDEAKDQQAAGVRNIIDGNRKFSRQRIYFPLSASEVRLFVKVREDRGRRRERCAIVANERAREL